MEEKRRGGEKEQKVRCSEGSRDEGLTNGRRKVGRLRGKYQWDRWRW